MLEIFSKVKTASRSLALIPDARRDEILLAVADAILANEASLLEANAKDLSRMDKSNPLYDRLQLTLARLADIASDMRHVAALPSPLGRVLKEKTLENGLHLRRVSVPFGVIGMVYEARPNVSFDVFSLCFKSGNACILKGGKDADDSNQAIITLIHSVLDKFGVDNDVVALLPSTHEATAEMLNAVGYISRNSHLCLHSHIGGGSHPCHVFEQSSSCCLVGAHHLVVVHHVEAYYGTLQFRVAGEYGEVNEPFGILRVFHRDYYLLIVDSRVGVVNLSIMECYLLRCFLGG